MALTYDAIATVTVGSGGASSIEFTSIPGTYTDLLVKLSARSTRNVFLASGVDITFNGSSSGYAIRDLTKQSGSVASYTESGQAQASIGWVSQDTDTANTFGTGEIYIPNYAGSNNKSFSVEMVQENNSTDQYMALVAGLWSNTSAITSLKLRIFTGSFNFKQYSTATLYGIKNTV